MRKTKSMQNILLLIVIVTDVYRRVNFLNLRHSSYFKCFETISKWFFLNHSTIIPNDFQKQNHIFAVLNGNVGTIGYEMVPREIFL